MAWRARVIMEKRRTHSECARDGIKADVDFVYKVGGVRYAGERAARVDIVLPSVELFVALEGEIVTLVAGFEQDAVRLDIGALDVAQITELDGVLDRQALFTSGAWSESAYRAREGRKMLRHLGLVYRERTVVEHEELFAPDPAREGVLLEADIARADDAGLVGDGVAVAEGERADARGGADGRVRGAVCGGEGAGADGGGGRCLAEGHGRGRA
jgi:hypothetical protein